MHVERGAPPSPPRPLTYVIPPVARLLNRENVFAPGTKPTSYVIDTGFAENMLTTDPETYGWLGEHAASAPEFSLGGPSVQWVGSATRELDRLFAAARPDVPSLTFVGTDEQIVSTEAIQKYHAAWPSGTLRIVDGARHEVMMEAPHMRLQFMEGLLEFYAEAFSR